MIKYSGAAAHPAVFWLNFSCSESRLSSVLFRSISRLIETNPCPSSSCVFFTGATSQQISFIWPLITFTNLHISPVYFNTLCAGGLRNPISSRHVDSTSPFKYRRRRACGRRICTGGVSMWTNILGGENCPRTASTLLLWEIWKVLSHDDFHNPSHLCQ